MATRRRLTDSDKLTPAGLSVRDLFLKNGFTFREEIFTAFEVFQMLRLSTSNTIHYDPLPSSHFDEWTPSVFIISDHEIDMVCLPTITEQDLKDLNIGKTFGERRKLFMALQSLKKQGSPTKSAYVQDSKDPMHNEGHFPAGTWNTMPTIETNYFTQPLSRPEHYNIKAILQSQETGTAVLDDLEQGRMPSVANRRVLIQLAVSHLIENCGRHLYPTREQKEALAVAIVTQFPCMKDQLQGVQGHEYLYSAGSGFIEYRLKTLRSTAARQKAHSQAKGHGRASELSERKQCDIAKQLGEQYLEIIVKEDDWDDDEEQQEVLRKIEWLKYHQPNHENVDKIRSHFKDTHEHRMKLIYQGNQTITDVINDYPCYRDMPSLIAYDFQLKFGAEVGDAFTSAWHEDYAQRILTLARTQKNSSVSDILDMFGDEGDADLCALYCLVGLLPSSNGHACRRRSKGARKKPTASKADAVNHVFQHKPVGTDVAQYTNTEMPAELTQPFLLCLGPQTRPEEFFVIADHQALRAGDTALVAFDLLFKTHYIFNVQYDAALHTFFTFFAAVIYKCAQNEVSPMLRAFNMLLSSQKN